MKTTHRHIIYSPLYQKEAKEYRDYLGLLGYTLNTCEAKYIALKIFFSYLETNGIYHLEAITTAQISNFHQHLQNRKNSITGQLLHPKTVYSLLRCMQGYLGYALHLNKIKTHPGSHLHFNYPDTQQQRIIFSPETITQLYRITQTQQEKAILHLGYGCGLRVSEISRLNREDIHLRENLVIVQKGKNSKRRIIPITERVSKELGLFFSSEEIPQEKGQAVFINQRGRRMQTWTLNSTLKALVLKTELGQKLSAEQRSRMGMHTLRHSIATHLLAAGMALEQVQLFLGHSHIESTEIYTHISQNQLKGLIQ